MSSSDDVEQLKAYHQSLVYSDSSSEEESSDDDDAVGQITVNTTPIGKLIESENIVPEATASTAPIATSYSPPPSPSELDHMDAEARKAYYGSLTYSDSDSDSDSSDSDELIDDVSNTSYNDGKSSTTAADMTSTELTMEIDTEEDWDALMASYKPITRRAVGEGMDVGLGIQEKKKKKILTWEESQFKYRTNLRNRRHNRWLPSENIYSVEEETIETIEEWFLPLAKKSSNPGAAAAADDDDMKGDTRECDVMSDDETIDDADSKSNVIANSTSDLRTSLTKRSSSTISAFEEIASRGTRMTKHNKMGLSHRKLIRVTPSGQLDWFSGSVSLKDIITIQPVPMKPTRFIVTTLKKQVELECNSPTERKIWVRGLQVMVSSVQNDNTISKNDDTEFSNVLAATDVNSDIDNDGSKAMEAKQKFDLEAWKAVSSAGVYLIRHKDKASKPKFVRVNHVSGVIDWESNERSMQHAAVLRGKTSKGLKNVSDKIAPPELCLCLTWEDKELNLQFPTTEDRNEWYQGLRSIKSQLSYSGRLSQAMTLSESAWLELAEKGVVFVKHGRYGNAHKRLVWVVKDKGVIHWSSNVENKQEATKNKKKTYGNVADVISIQRGKQTSNLKRVNDKVVPPSLCFSLTWRNRSLDLEAGSENERDLWVTNLKAMQKKLLSL